jgi:1-acyl-sn-glycerol-3-phosphate acyltransferase
MRKPARPRVLNLLKPLLADPLPPFARARSLLGAGRAVGVFPEGTVNRDPARLLAGRLGAARLSLETGVAIVPAGIRFPTADPTRPIREDAPLELRIGARLDPPRVAGSRASPSELRAWHAMVMREIGRLAGKAWTTT